MKRFLTAAFILALGIIAVAFKVYPFKKLNIVFVGDSITEGSGGPAFRPSVYAVDYLKAKLTGIAVNQANAGFSGRTTLDFLPGESDYNKVITAADTLYTQGNSQLLFSIMIGTNDSAVKGTHGAPVSAATYKKNIGIVIDTLLRRYPNSKIILNKAIWYSPNTQNNSVYLAQGLARLQSYSPEIDALIKTYKRTYPGRVLAGDKAGFNLFKENYGAFKQEQGANGIFYLHPNERGASQLGLLWGKAIYKALQ